MFRLNDLLFDVLSNKAVCLTAIDGLVSDMDSLLMIWWKCSLVLFHPHNTNGLASKNSKPAYSMLFLLLRFLHFQIDSKQMKKDRTVWSWTGYCWDSIWLTLFLFQTMFKCNQKCLVKQNDCCSIFDFNHHLKTLLTPLSQNYKPLNVVKCAVCTRMMIEVKNSMAKFLLQSDWNEKNQIESNTLQKEIFFFDVVLRNWLHVINHFCCCSVGGNSTYDYLPRFEFRFERREKKLIIMRKLFMVIEWFVNV